MKDYDAEILKLEEKKRRAALRLGLASNAEFQAYQESVLWPDIRGIERECASMSPGTFRDIHCYQHHLADLQGKRTALLGMTFTANECKTVYDETILEIQQLRDEKKMAQSMPSRHEAPERRGFVAPLAEPENPREQGDWE